MYEKIRDTAQAMSCFKKGKAYRRGQSNITFLWGSFNIVLLSLKFVFISD